MSRKRQILSGQGWIEAPARELQAIGKALVSDQPETVLSAEGRVRVHRLAVFPPRPEVERVNVSGEASIAPVGAVRRKSVTERKPARFKIEPPTLSASGAHIFTAKEGEIASGASDPWLAVAIVRVLRRAGDAWIEERDLIDLAEAEVIRMSLGRLMAEGRLTESWNGSDFEYREP